MDLFSTSKDSVVRYIRGNREGCRLLLSMAKRSFGSKFYNPTPPIVLADFQHVNIDRVIDFVDKKITDEDLLKKFGKEIYGFVKYTVLGSLLKVERTNYISEQELEAYGFISGSVQVYQILHEKDEHPLTVSYLFHGSGMERWYSIVMNGLRVFSGTVDMLNGAAYGKGIYLSSSSHLSMNYTRKYKKYIIGVFEVNGDKNIYKKSSAIYVIPSEKLVRLRYLLVCDGTSSVSNITKLLDYKFISRLPQIKKCEKQITNTITNRRLLKEIGSIQKINETTGIILSIPDDSNMYLWYCSFPRSCINSDTGLYSDMKKYNISEIKLEIRFPNRYPIHPPFVRVIYPRLQFQTGHVTSGGSICIEILTHSKENGWSPSVSVETLMITIKSLLIEGEGRLAEDAARQYSLTEAEASFKRIVLAHGWK